MNNTYAPTNVSARLYIGIGIAAAIVLMTTAPLFSYAATLDRQLDIGMSGSDVSALQTFLAQDNTIYPQGLVTGYFGGLTHSAVSNFQARNNIANVGRVGPITLVALNDQMGGMVSGSDMTAPTIYSVGITTSTNSANVSWNTNENAKGVIYYSTSPLTEYELPHATTISGSIALTDTALHTFQNVSISGLQTNTTYYYDVYVTDAAGNVSMTMQSTFHTTN